LGPVEGRVFGGSRVVIGKKNKFLFVLFSGGVRSESGSRMGQGRRKCCRAGWDEEGGRGQEACLLSPPPFLIPNPNWVGGEGWEEAVHMPTSVAYVTEEHCILVKGAFAYLALGIIGGEAVIGIGGGGYGCRRG